MLQFTVAIHYGLEALVYLATQPPDAVVPSHVIAEARGMPERFLLKILRPLVSAGLLRSVKGPNGGFRLVRPIRVITILDVALAVEPGFLTVPAGREGRLAPYLEQLGTEVAAVARSVLARRTLADCVAADGKVGRKK